MRAGLGDGAIPAGEVGGGESSLEIAGGVEGRRPPPSGHSARDGQVAKGTEVAPPGLATTEWWPYSGGSRRPVLVWFG